MKWKVIGEVIWTVFMMLTLSFTMDVGTGDRESDGSVDVIGEESGTQDLRMRRLFQVKNWQEKEVSESI